MSIPFQAKSRITFKHFYPIQILIQIKSFSKPNSDQTKILLPTQSLFKPNSYSNQNFIRSKSWSHSNLFVQTNPLAKFLSKPWSMHPNHCPNQIIIKTKSLSKLNLYPNQIFFQIKSLFKPNLYPNQIFIQTKS